MSSMSGDKGPEERRGRVKGYVDFSGEVHGFGDGLHHIGDRHFGAFVHRQNDRFRIAVITQHPTDHNTTPQRSEPNALSCGTKAGTEVSVLQEEFGQINGVNELTQRFTGSGHSHVRSVLCATHNQSIERSTDRSAQLSAAHHQPKAEGRRGGAVLCAR
jgi:hypothetical protein